jgi:hypothetical protein
MKKVYVFIGALFVALTGSAQLSQEGGIAVDRSMVGRGQEAVQQPLLPENRVTIWTDDFADPATWSIDNAYNNGNTEFVQDLNFLIGTGLEPTGPAAIDAIASASPDNGFAMVDSDEFGGEEGGDGIENCWFQTVESIDCTDFDNVSIKFDTFYRMWDNGNSDGNEYCLVEISHDGVTWPDVTTYEVADADPGMRFECFPTMETQDPVDNPTLMVFNITEGAANEGEVWLRFRWKGTWGYAWMVDDVEVFETPENDLTISNAYRGDIINDYDYYAIPEGQVKPMVFGAGLWNFGFADQEATNLNIDVAGPETGNWDMAIDLAAGAADTVWFETGDFEPTTLGTYDITMTVPADDFPEGDTDTEGFEITDLIFGHDTPNEDMFARGFNQDDEVAIGQTYYMETDAQLGGLNVMFATGTTAGMEVQVFCYEIGADIQDLSYQGEGSYIVEAGDINTGNYTTIPFNDAIDLFAGAGYVVEVRKYFSSDRLYIAANVKDEDFSTVNYGPFGAGDAENWYVAWNWDPAVRMNLDPSINIAEPVASANFSLGQNLPNPANLNTTINYELQVASDVKLEIFDMMGRVVLNEDYGTLSAGTHNVIIDVTAFEAGVYSYRMTAGLEQLSKEMIVK